jgi:hypothetical protein
MILPTNDIAAVPTFIGSGILFLASGTMVVACSNTMFEKNAAGVYTHQSPRARRLRDLLWHFSLFLIIAYGVLFASFFFHQMCKMLEIDPSRFISFFLDEKAIYIMQISLFPTAVLFAAFLVRMYIGIRRDEPPPAATETVH